MFLRNVNFSPVMNAAGAEGFFREGYPYHKYWRWAGLTFDSCGFVAKTTTLMPNVGNMPLQSDGITPKDFRPACIKAYPWSGHVLNAVGLSGPGLEFLLQQNRWQQLLEPFFISFMSIAKTDWQRLAETRGFVKRLKAHLPNFKAAIGLEINYSCPNVGLKPEVLVGEVHEGLNEVAALDIPTSVKLNALVPPQAARTISMHPTCDAITMSNSIPFGALEERIDWKRVIGKVSPLAHLGSNGGLSGNSLLPIVLDWIRDAHCCGLTKPIIGCGGIMNREAVRRMYNVGASAIQLGSVAILRPWRMRGMVAEAHSLFPPW